MSISPLIDELHKYVFNHKARRLDGMAGFIGLRLRTFLQVAIRAKHLTIIGCRVSALTPTA